MMTIEERIKMYKSKKLFIDNISRALEVSNTNVMRVDYEVLTKFNDVFKIDVYNEFIIVTFVGGAKSVKSTSGNSDSANFREIGKLIDGGYYDEVRYYESLFDEGFTKVNLEH